jgi:DNA invertase Pin-like site-specific DNA recombinase
MGRTSGSKDLTSDEAERIKSLYKAGVRVLDIASRVGRAEGTVQRIVRGMKRKRPPPIQKPRTKRNDFILMLTERGMTRAAIAELLGMGPSQVGKVVATHPKVVELLRKKGARPAEIARRFRMELSTALRIAGNGKKVPRSRTRLWAQQ